MTSIGPQQWQIKETILALLQQKTSKCLNYRCVATLKVIEVQFFFLDQLILYI
jgi:hypothetical protein